jgi:AcrR family transcriptional regulator
VMAVNILKTEDKILDAASSIFLLYGFHGTTLQRIAIEAGVNKSVIHYYFRSKERLYFKVVKIVIDLVWDNESEKNADQEIHENLIWFIVTELYNNEILFEHSLREINPHDFETILNYLKKRFNNISCISPSR